MDILPSLLESDLLHSISLTLLHFLWQGFAIAIILLCVKRLTSNKHSELRYLVSLLCLTLCVIAPIITFLIISQPEHAAAVTSNYVSSSFDHVTSLHNDIGQLYFSDFTPLIAVVWMSGVALLSMRLGWQMVQVHRLTTTNIIEPSNKLEDIFECLKQQLAVAKRTRLIISLSAQVPMAIGWVIPVVLLPANLVSGLTIAQLEMLMAHELAHIKRYDYLVNLIQTFVELVLFFHPAVKWISKQTRIEREYCCDDIALSHCGNHLHYARALTEAEVLRQNIPELAMAATGGDLKSRIHRAVGQHSCAPRYGNQWLAALAAVLVVPSIFTASKVIAMTQTEPVITPRSENQQVMVLDAKLNQTQKTQPVSKDVKKDTVIISELATEEDLTAQTFEKDVTVVTETSAVVQTKKPSLAQQKEVVSLTQPTSDISMTLDTQKIEKTHDLAINTTATKGDSDEAFKPSTENKTVPSKALLISNKQQTPITTKTFEQPTVLETDSSSISKSETIQAAQTPDTIDAIKPAVEQPKFVDAKLIESVMPSYPRVYSSLRGQEDIAVTFTVNTEGKVKNIEFQSGVGKSFKRNITRALNKWRFEPALNGTTKVETQKRKVFSFNDPSQYLRPVTGSRIARRVR